MIKPLEIPDQADGRGIQLDQESAVIEMQDCFEYFTKVSVVVQWCNIVL